MKTTLALMMIAVSCISFAHSSVKVHSSENRQVDFSGYSSFAFTNAINAMDASDLSDMIVTTQVKEAVAAELMGLGYRLSDTGPQLIVHFRIFTNTAVVPAETDDGKLYSPK